MQPARQRRATLARRTTRAPACPHAGHGAASIALARTSVRSRKNTVPAQPSPVHTTSSWSSISMNSAAGVVCHPHSARRGTRTRPNACRARAHARRTATVGRARLRDAARHAVTAAEHEHHPQRRPRAVGERGEHGVLGAGDHGHVVARRAAGSVDDRERDAGAARAAAELPRLDAAGRAADERRRCRRAPMPSARDPLRAESGEAHEVGGRRADGHAVGTEEVDGAVLRLDGAQERVPAAPRRRPHRARAACTGCPSGSAPTRVGRSDVVAPVADLVERDRS